jgi:hypothetical protein
LRHRFSLSHLLLLCSCRIQQKPKIHLIHFYIILDPHKSKKDVGLHIQSLPTRNVQYVAHQPVTTTLCCSSSVR